MIDKEDLLLLILLAPGRAGETGVRGITRLEKITFLVEKELDLSFLEGEHFEFEPLHFGPFSRAIYDSLDFLMSCDLVDVTEVELAGHVGAYEESSLVELDEQQPIVERRYDLTGNGTKVAEILPKEVPAQAWESLRHLKASSAAIPLAQLIRNVYRKYPKFAERSELDHLKD